MIPIAGNLALVAVVAFASVHLLSTVASGWRKLRGARTGSPSIPYSDFGDAVTP